MKKLALSIVAMGLSMGVWSVPAYPGWQTKSQADGTTIELRLVGDEFYSFWETRDGQLAYELNDGRFVKSTQPVPSADESQQRHAEAMKRQRPIRKAIGTPFLPQKGLVILVNFADSEMAPSHTLTVFDNQCNAANGACTTNAYEGVNYPSAAQYFADQSNGTYRPEFDIFGPITLPHEVAYYGEPGVIQGDSVSDRYLADFVIDAVLKADSLGCDFSQYDSNDDGYVDFIFFIFAGKGQEAGGTSETIWSHQAALNELLHMHYTHCTDDCIYYFDFNGFYNNPVELDGKIINTYACSAELNEVGELNGIGGLCHELGHVIGLPDFYDVAYGKIYQQGLTPGAWDIMDMGSYNGGGHCPPNYDPWEKYFFGWIQPVNLGNESSSDTLYANGSIEYNVFQVNESGELQGPWENSECFHLENRQQQGWDTFVPNHGLVVWRIKYNSGYWAKNTVNSSSTRWAPYFNIVSVGSDEWYGISEKPVTNVKEENGIVTFNYMTGDTTELPEPIWTNWAYYDTGTYQKNFSYKNHRTYWGIMFPKYTLGKDFLTKVAIYERTDKNLTPLTIVIYVGGDIPEVANIVYVQDVEPAGVNGWHEVTFWEPVPIDRRRNLWVTVNAEPGGGYPALACRYTGDPNGSWVSSDGVNWKNVNSYEGYDHTWLLRAYIQNEGEEEGIEEITNDQSPISNKVIKDGQILILRGDKTYTLTGQEVK